MLFEVNERLEGLKYNIDFGGRGWGYTGDDNRYVHYVKGPILDPNKLKAIYTLPFRLTKDTKLCIFK